MAVKSLDSQSKLEDLISFAKEVALDRFNRTELALRKTSVVLNLLQAGTSTLCLDAGCLTVPEELIRYQEILVPEADEALRKSFFFAEAACNRARQDLGVERDPLGLIRSDRSACREIADKAAKASVILAEVKKLQRLADEVEKTREITKKREQTKRLYQGHGKLGHDGTWKEIDGMRVEGGKLPELEGMTINTYLAECRKRREAKRACR